MKFFLRRLHLLLVVVTLNVIVSGQDTLVYKSYLNNKVHIQLPTYFYELDSSAIADKFSQPGYRLFVMLKDRDDFSSLKIIEFAKRKP